MRSEWFYLLVLDQHGEPAPNAHVTVRERETYAIAASRHTDEHGLAMLNLDPLGRYIVIVGRRQGASDEMWWYGYIEAEDWEASQPKMVRRKEPWIQRVALPEGPWLSSEPQDIEVEVGFGYADTSYQLHIRATLWIDDDGSPPYAFRQTTDYQNVYEGPLQPFRFSPSLSACGDYAVRVYVERRFKDTIHGLLPWTGADEGGWSWPLSVSCRPPSTEGPDTSQVWLPLAVLN
jgi:hypothetical protein